MLSLPCTAYDRILLCLFLVFLTLFWAFLSFQIHPNVEPFAAEFEGELFFFGHAKFDDVSAVVRIVVVSGRKNFFGVLGEYQPPIFWAVL